MQDIATAKARWASYKLRRTQRHQMMAEDDMQTTMTCKGYNAAVEYDEEVQTFHGEVVNLRDVITFQGRSVSELKNAFAESVKDYLAFCNERGEDPDEPIFPG